MVKQKENTAKLLVMTCASHSDFYFYEKGVGKRKEEDGQEKRDKRQE
jgi:hypothetical protein